jgi:four helix bundle protein
MSNIAEGFENRTQLLFIDYLGRAKASAGELKSQAFVAMDCGYLRKTEIADLFELCDKCSR